MQRGDLICSREQKGKLIITDVAVSSSSRATCYETQMLFDLFISTLTPGREHDEKEWSELFKEAGFRDYYGPVRLAEKLSQNIVPADLLWEKNTLPT